jgi:hypothetical protein
MVETTCVRTDSITGLLLPSIVYLNYNLNAQDVLVWVRYQRDSSGSYKKNYNDTYDVESGEWLPANWSRERQDRTLRGQWNNDNKRKFLLWR